MREIRSRGATVESEDQKAEWSDKLTTISTVAPRLNDHSTALKSGDRVAGLTITLATGAAGLKGKIIPAGGARLPLRLRAHLVPAEPPAEDDLLRFAESLVESNGSFRFANLAPGKYLIITREIPGSEAPDEPAPPVAWDASERAKLRKEAEAAKVEIELKACQRVSDFELKLVR